MDEYIRTGSDIFFFSRHGRRTFRLRVDMATATRQGARELETPKNK
jgi:hypothetical protein